jgi:hypothetical protein
VLDANNPLVKDQRLARFLQPAYCCSLEVRNIRTLLQVPLSVPVAVFNSLVGVAC